MADQLEKPIVVPGVRSAGGSMDRQHSARRLFRCSPLFATRTQPGSLDPRAHEIINAYTLGFFDRYLRGRDSDLLKGRSSPYAEVTLKQKQ